MFLEILVRLGKIKKCKTRWNEKGQHKELECIFLPCSLLKPLDCTKEENNIVKGFLIELGVLNKAFRC